MPWLEPVTECMSNAGNKGRSSRTKYSLRDVPRQDYDYGRQLRGPPISRGLILASFTEQQAAPSWHGCWGGEWGRRWRPRGWQCWWFWPFRYWYRLWLVHNILIPLCWSLISVLFCAVRTIITSVHCNNHTQTCISKLLVWAGYGLGVGIYYILYTMQWMNYILNAHPPLWCGSMAHRPWACNT